MPLFEVAIIRRPTKKEAEDGTGKETLVFGPEAMIARDQQSAGFAAIRSDKLTGEDFDRLEVYIRPFA